MKKVYQIPEAYVEDLYEQENLLEASLGGEGQHPQNGGNGDEFEE